MLQLLLVSIEAVGAGGLPQEDLLPSGLLSQRHESSQAGTGLALKFGSLQVLPGGRLLASADESGIVAVADLRMLGGPTEPVLGRASTPSPVLWSGRSRCQCSSFTYTWFFYWIVADM